MRRSSYDEAPWSWFKPFLEIRPAKTLGGFNVEKGRFHIVLWNEAGLGWFAQISKGGSPVTYNYGPFERGRMRNYLNRLFPEVDLANRTLGVEGILNASKGAGVLVQVDASTLAKIWRPVQFRKWKATR